MTKNTELDLAAEDAYSRVVEDKLDLDHLAILD